MIRWLRPTFHVFVAFALGALRGLQRGLWPLLVPSCNRSFHPRQETMQAVVPCGGPPMDTLDLRI